MIAHLLIGICLGTSLAFSLLLLLAAWREWQRVSRIKGRLG